VVAQGCVVVYTSKYHPNERHTMFEASEIVAIEQELSRQQADLGYFLKAGDTEQASSLNETIQAISTMLADNR